MSEQCRAGLFGRFIRLSSFLLVDRLNTMHPTSYSLPTHTPPPTHTHSLSQAPHPLVTPTALRPPQPSSPLPPLPPLLLWEKRFQLAEHRYGLEELQQLYSDDLLAPVGMPPLSPIIRPEILVPLSFMPLSEEEQVCE